ncbi:NUDIX domain-containing protein [Weissella cibaria]|uniref:MutT protein n=1 Tax=Weissella cibaria TaxID=137591 RepID=A0A0D1JWZ2_9LACO|nr:NUDIX domain-containing protein [Weissella cibaria]KIU25763.1 8-oxo-dGTP diphosphatase [Weissella cibaria]
MAEQNYIARMRAKVGHDGMIFNTVFGVLWSADRSAILLEKRSDIQKGWGFPGGYVECGETPQQAIVREFKEETGLTVQVKRLIGVSSEIVAENRWGDAQETLAMGFEVTLVTGELQEDGDETLHVQHVPVNPEPLMFVPQAQKTVHQVINDNEQSDAVWLRED